jgi:hypothetical protein
VADPFPTRKVPLAVIEEEADTQSRDGINWEFVDELAERIADGVVLPPGDVFVDEAGRYFLAEGWHRYLAHKKLAKNVMIFRVHKGSEDDALLFAFGSNKDHGLRRTNADKKRSVLGTLAHPKCSGWSIRQVAEHCGVSSSSVARYRDGVKEKKAPKAGGTRAPKGRLSTDLAAPATVPFEVNGHTQTTLPLAGKPAPVVEGFPYAEEDAEGFAAADEPAPAEGVDLDTLAGPYRRWARSLSDLKAEFRRIAQKEDIGGHVAQRITRIEALVDELRGTIYQAEPMAVCEKCQGDGCQFCARTGFWTRTIVQSRKAPA